MSTSRAGLKWRSAAGDPDDVVTERSHFLDKCVVGTTHREQCLGRGTHDLLLGAENEPDQQHQFGNLRCVAAI